MISEPFLRTAFIMIVTMAMVIVLYGIPQLLDAFYNRVFIFVFNQVEADIALQKIYFHIVHALFIQVLLYGKRAVGAGHSFNLPVHFFRSICHMLVRFQIYRRSASRGEILS